MYDEAINSWYIMRVWKQPTLQQELCCSRSIATKLCCKGIQPFFFQTRTSQKLYCDRIIATEPVIQRNLIIIFSDRAHLRQTNFAIKILLLSDHCNKATIVKGSKAFFPITKHCSYGDVTADLTTTGMFAIRDLTATAASSQHLDVGNPNIGGRSAASLVQASGPATARGERLAEMGYDAWCCVVPL